MPLPLRLGAAVLLIAGLAACSPAEVLQAVTPGTVVTPQRPDSRDGLQATHAPDNYTVRPAKREVTPERVRSLRVPDGFAIEVFEDGLENPRILAAHSGGWLYVSEREAGRVRLLQDTDGDGRADRSEVVAEDLDEVHGLAIHDGWLYMVGIHDLWRARIQGNGALGEPEHLRDDLPNAGQHPNRTIGFDRQGRMYLTIGSTTNAFPEEEPEMATMMRGSADGSNLEIYAEGLRNTIGFGWHPETGELWGMDHGSDGRGNDTPLEELNRIREGRHYGWPFCHNDRQVDWMVPAEPEEGDKASFCATSEPDVLRYQAHAAPMQMAFYTGDAFPAEYRNDAFAAMRGSWNRNPPVGYEVVRIRFNDGGQPTAIEPFITGWLIENGRAQFGRLTGMASGADGALYLTDDSGGVVYRIAYGN
jgi:glucose/arabinose dehydrogenase